MTIGSSRSQKDAARIVPKGHEMLAQVSVGLAAKRLEIIARGFSPGLAEPTSALKVAPEAVCPGLGIVPRSIDAPVTGFRGRGRERSRLRAPLQKDAAKDCSR